MSTKTHFRKVFKSDHLSTADLEELIEEGKSLIFTIKEVKQEYNKKVACNNGNFNIAYFVEPIKPLVLNVTNSKIIKGFCNSPFVEDWTNVRIELYIEDAVRMKGEIVGGVRIRQYQPQEKHKPLFTKDKFAKAKEQGATVEFIKKHYTLTEKIQKEYESYS